MDATEYYNSLGKPGATYISYEDAVRESLGSANYVVSTPSSGAYPSAPAAPKPTIAALKADANAHQGEPYVKGSNDCDIWLENRFTNTGYPIADDWLPALDNDVPSHMEALDGKLVSDPINGANVIFQKEQHVGLFILNKDSSVDLYHQGWNPGPIHQSQHYHFDSYDKFKKSGWSGNKVYYPVGQYQ